MNDTIQNPFSPAAVRSFNELPLSPGMLATLQQLGYLAMTPIQAASLPITLAGHDLIAQAKTGKRQDGGIRAAPVNPPEPAPLCGASHGAVPHARTGRPGHAGDTQTGAFCRQTSRF